MSGEIMSESKSAKFVVVFILAIIAFGISSVVAFSTGGLIGTNLLNFDDDSNYIEDNSPNPFALELNTSSSNNSQNHMPSKKIVTPSSNSTSDDGNNKTVKTDKGNDNKGSDSGSSSDSDASTTTKKSSNT